LLQHAKYTTPNLNHGYCVDDNARGLIALTKYYSLRKDEAVFTFNPKIFSGFYTTHLIKKMADSEILCLTIDAGLNYQVVKIHMPAHCGGLGITVKEAPDGSIRNMAMRYFLMHCQRLNNFTSPRAWRLYCIRNAGVICRLPVGERSLFRRLRDELAKKI